MTTKIQSIRKVLTYSIGTLAVSLVGLAVLVLSVPEVGLGSLVIQHAASMSLDRLAVGVQPHPPGVVEVHAVVAATDRIDGRPQLREEHVVHRGGLVQELVHHGQRLGVLPLAPHGPGVPPAPGGRHLEPLLLHHLQLPHDRPVDLARPATLVILAVGDEQVEIQKDHQRRQTPHQQGQGAVARRVAVAAQGQRFGMVLAPRAHGHAAATHPLQLVRAATGKGERVSYQTVKDRIWKFPENEQARGYMCQIKKETSAAWKSSILRAPDFIPNLAQHDQKFSMFYYEMISGRFAKTEHIHLS